MFVLWDDDLPVVGMHLKISAQHSGQSMSGVEGNNGTKKWTGTKKKRDAFFALTV